MTATAMVNLGHARALAERVAGWLVPRLPFIVSFLLVIAIARVTASLTWKLVPVEEETAAPPLPPALSTSKPSSHRAPAERIAELRLFGRADTALTQSGSTEAPDTQLNLALRGVIAADDPAFSRAFISAGGSDEKSYAVGAVLPGGARVHAILADRVILERAGQLETLRMPRGAEDDIAMTTADESSGAIPETPDLSDIREAVRDNPRRLIDIVRPQPVIDPATGKQRGYRLFPGRDREQFVRLGLQPGDMVTAINGVVLDDPNKGLQLLKELDTGGQINLTIERDGSIQTLVLPLTQ